MEFEARPGVYVLAGVRPNYLYKGSARDVAARIAMHVAGRVARTRSLRPIEVVHVAYMDDYTAARQRELWLKTGEGRAWLKSELSARVAKWQTQET
jgi:predicted GIY-YIG superfamily endonuclease